MERDELIAAIEEAIAKGELLIWVHGPKGGADALANAVSVCENGDAIQIEVDPSWTFRSL